MADSGYIDRVVPLFQIFGDQTGRLSYKWREAFSQKYAEINADNINCKPANARYVDGMGYDKNNEERLVMELSGGQLKKISSTLVMPH